MNQEKISTETVPNLELNTPSMFVRPVSTEPDPAGSIYWNIFVILGNF